MAEDYFYISYSERDAILTRASPTSCADAAGDWMSSRIIRDEAWTKEMTDGIRDCGAVIVLGTLEAEGSEPMRREVVAPPREPTSRSCRCSCMATDVLSGHRQGPHARAGTPYIDLKPGRMPLQDFYARLHQIMPPIGARSRRIAAPSKPGKGPGPCAVRAQDDLHRRVPMERSERTRSPTSGKGHSIL